MDFRLVNEKVVVRARSTSRGAGLRRRHRSGEHRHHAADRAAARHHAGHLHAQRGRRRVGLRGLQLARIDSLELGSLKLRNIPCLIKNPPLRDIPVKETEGLSPLALGYSMVIDYKTHKLTFGKHLPEEPKDFELPLRLHRLATVRGMVDGTHQANFVVDTGGEVISISQATATALASRETGRRIALKVYGTSGWDPDAFLMPGVDLLFDAIQYKNFPVVVLNLDAPSALLGFQLGGIVGHKFLSKYRVGIDLERSVLRLKARLVKPEVQVLQVDDPSTCARRCLAARACASSHTRRSSSVSTNSGGTARVCRRWSIATNVRNARLVQLAPSGQRLLGEDVDLHFERGREDAGDARLQDDQVADLDRVEELQVVDGGGDEQRARVAVTGDGAGDVDEVHHRAAEDESERVGVVRQHDLHHFRGGIGGALRCQVHRAMVVGTAPDRDRCRIRQYPVPVR